VPDHIRSPAVLAGKKPIQKEAKALAASVLSQDEKKGSLTSRAGAPVPEFA
jgi:hypothetical protein